MHDWERIKLTKIEMETKYNYKGGKNNLTDCPFYTPEWNKRTGKLKRIAAPQRLHDSLSQCKTQATHEVLEGDLMITSLSQTTVTITSIIDRIIFIGSFKWLGLIFISLNGNSVGDRMLWVECDIHCVSCPCQRCSLALPTELLTWIDRRQSRELIT